MLPFVLLFRIPYFTLQMYVLVILKKLLAKRQPSCFFIEYLYIYIYIYINTIKSSYTECNKNNIDIQKKHYRLNVSTEVFISNTLQIKWS